VYLQGIETSRKAKRILGKLNDQKQLMFALAEVDDVAVLRIVKVALRQGCGPNAIVERLKNAQEGLYKCQTYLVSISPIYTLQMSSKNAAKT
jgi:hypothetical protein